MEVLLLYVSLAVLSLGSCAAGFYAETVAGNIRHLKNGREPNAGAAIFPTIPLVPMAHFGLVYGLNQISSNLGWYVAFGYFFVAAIYSFVSISKRKRELDQLNENRNHS